MRIKLNLRQPRKFALGMVYVVMWRGRQVALIGRGESSRWLIGVKTETGRKLWGRFERRGDALRAVRKIVAATIQEQS